MNLLYRWKRFYAIFLPDVTYLVHLLNGCDLYENLSWKVVVTERVALLDVERLNHTYDHLKQ